MTLRTVPITAFLLIASACTDRGVTTLSDPSEAADSTQMSSAIQTVRLNVEELTCEGCAVQIREILQAIVGVDGVQTDVKQKAVTVEYDATRVTLAQLTAALAEETYTATPSKEPGPEGGCTPAGVIAANAPVLTMQVPIEGMTCAACVGRVKQALADVYGVKSVEVRLAHRDALVDIVEGAVSAGCLRSTITGLGYTVGAPKVMTR